MSAIHAGVKLSAIRNAAPQRSQGFTLMEVMIALMIVAVALPALVTLVLAQVDSAAHVREKSYAMWIAENELTRLTLLNTNKEVFTTYKLPEKDVGTVEMMGQRWQWQLEAKPNEDIALLLKLEISVSALGPIDGGIKSGITAPDPLATLTGYMSE